ncbi:MAG: PDZ domain-containing protein [Syntrophales bacterium]|nr:PDZ domain-containing protein [Syntrophales bacterium]
MRKFDLGILGKEKIESYFRRGGRYILWFVFLCIIAYQLAGIVYRVIILNLSLPAYQQRFSTPSMTNSGEKTNWAELHNLIVERNLFGSSKEPLAQKIKATGQEDTSSRWELKGTVVFNSHIGYAILFEKSKGIQRLLTTGQKVENTTLLRVGRDYCVLEEGGKQYFLRSSGAKLSPLMPQEGITIPRKDIMAHISNLGQMFNEARIVPYMVDGNAAGFQLLQVMPGSLFQRMGLMVGDVVQEVNDKKITGAEDVSQLIQALQTSSSLSITILRGGKTERLSYQFI